MWGLQGYESVGECYGHGGQDCAAGGCAAEWGGCCGGGGELQWDESGVECEGVGEFGRSGGVERGLGFEMGIKSIIKRAPDGGNGKLGREKGGYI